MNQTIQAFGYPETLIKDHKHWVVVLRPDQVTVGSMIIAAKSEAVHLGDLSSEKWSEFAEVCKEVEELTMKGFGAEKFNYLALMMVDPNVHFHFVPRYSKPVEINGNEYKDNDWPVKTELKPLDMPSEDFETIKKKLKASLT